MRPFLVIALVAVVALSAPLLASAACGPGQTVDLSNSNNCVSTGDVGTTPQAQTGFDVGTTPAAQTNPSSSSGGSVTLVNPLGSGTSLESFLGNILEFVVRIGTIIVILMLVFVGYKFVVAQGSETKLTEAKKMLLWTVVGALVLLGAQAIASGIQATVQALGG